MRNDLDTYIDDSTLHSLMRQYYIGDITAEELDRMLHKLAETDSKAAKERQVAQQYLAGKISAEEFIQEFAALNTSLPPIIAAQDPTVTLNSNSVEE